MPLAGTGALQGHTEGEERSLRPTAESLHFEFERIPLRY